MTMEFQDLTITVVTAIGFISVLKSLITILRWVWVMFLRPPKNLKDYGSWAVVTGATDGIGKALAFRLASKGLNIVLVGRNPSKLQATSMEITSSSSVEVKSVVVDLVKCSGKEIVEIMNKEIKDLDVGILVNNAGLSNPYPEFFLEVDLEIMENILKVNMEAATWMVLSVLPCMLRKKKGAIVNIGSASSAIFPSYPFFTIYAATKAYLAMLSRSISVEYKHSGIDIQCQIPVYVATKMTKLKESSIFIASPETYTKASVRSIGYEQICTPYWSHSLQWFIANALPYTLLNWGIFSYFVAVNKVAKLKETKKKPMQHKTLVDESN